MGAFTRYQRLIKLLQIMFAVNVCFVVFGVVAFIRYLQTYEITALTMSIAGFFILVFGIIVPIVIIVQISKIAAQAKHQTEEIFAKLIDGWLDNYRDHDEPIKDPVFWINLLLLGLEVFGEKVNHPVVRMLAEFAPIMKSQFKKSKSKRKSKRTPSREND